MPKGHRAILAKLLTMDAGQRAALLASLRATPAGHSLTRLGETIAAGAKLESDDAQALVGMLAGMYGAMVRGDETPENFAALAIDAAKENLGDFVPEEMDWDSGAGFIAELMKLDHPLGVSAKILGVIGDHDRVYCRSRILTDVRPVFAAAVSEPPAALVVVHTLKLTYHAASGSGDTQSLYVSLDSTDLEELQQHIERAMEKERTLKAVFASKDLNVVNTTELR